ncbi:tetratricopeptide repeat protein [Sinomicrobium pectinilyticum]|uniref:Tetratricopeptide repeat protein n=1 Tax=Sinomicrobium pectinilyticum TaxID=1084421 RepID=A0A3N0ER68_SINP1|nr:amidohydrolase family protein [Sinomicrobium pectinilyticum]RNL90353.1 tetratricopeptide repeat protein [Sinomicrobium pectinilyticum]
MKKLVFIFLGVLLFPACNKPPNYDLAIQNVAVFDSKNKKVLKNKTVLINKDSIAAIINASQESNAIHVIEGNGRLLIPGFIDTHTHLGQLYAIGDDVAPEYIDDSYRKRLSETYLKYGTTTIVSMGDPEEWMDIALNWQKNPSPDYPNLFISGGALISDEEREPVQHHVEILSPEDGKRKIREYAELGVKHIKLYSRLRKPEMKAILSEAEKQNINASGHIQFRETVPDAVDLGLKNFEHFFTLVSSVFDYGNHWEPFVKKYKLERTGTLDEFAADMALFFDYIANTPELKAKMDALLDKMASEGVTISTTINVLASATGDTDFYTSFNSFPLRSTPYIPTNTDSFREQASIGFGTMMKVLKTAHDKGIKIRIGTDCKYGGRALLSELMLLYKAGFSIKEILQIATWNGAEAMKIAAEYGSIEVGKKADLVLFDKNPFTNHENFLSKKTVIKGGKEFVPKENKIQQMLARINEKGVATAIQWYNGSEEKPLNGIELNEVGHQLLKSGNVKEAISIFKLNTAFFHNRKVYATHHFMEESLIDEGKYLLYKEMNKEAVEICEYTVGMFPNSSAAYQSLAEAYLADGNKELAIQNYKKAIELDPKNNLVIQALKRLSKL